MIIVKIFLLILCSDIQLTWTQISIPDTLRECYKNNATINPYLPLNLRIIVDIIQRLEKYSNSMVDMRVISTSILQRFKYDGIEYQKHVQATDDVIPFSGTGNERIKHSLIQELIPGNSDVLPTHILSLAEYCMLHQAVSNSIFKPDDENGYKPCSEILDKKELIGVVSLTGQCNCPRHRGVILTPYGTVSSGSIVGAVAASLQHQSVAINQLIKGPDAAVSETSTKEVYDTRYNEDEVDFILPKSLIINKPSMWYNASILSTIKIDNIWLATIAGELAEMVVYQGPLLGSNMTLGSTGLWQNTIYPMIFCLTSPHQNFEASKPKLIGGIDGMIIANYLQTWMKDFYSLRLSQIFQMYYSQEGIAFNRNIKACNRAQMFPYAVPKTILNEQTYAIAQTLVYRTPTAYVSPEALKRLVSLATEQFYTYAESQLFPDVSCPVQINQPQAEALVVLDGTWAVQYTIEFMSLLIEELDVSMYGTKMGIIHGTSGNWLLNVTNSPSLAFQTLNNFINVKWPTILNYTQVLRTVSIYLNDSWDFNIKPYKIGNTGQVVILLTPLGFMSSSEEESSLAYLRQLKHNHPDVHFIYYVSRYNANLFSRFILSEEDHLIQNSNMNDITQYVSNIPFAIRPVKYSKGNNPKAYQFEHYISPTKSVTYKIHSHWKRSVKEIIITVHTFGYGTLKACLWVAFNSTEKRNYNCTELAGYKQATLTDHLKCTYTSPCPNIYLRIQNVTSLYKCAEIECKTPDQVRYIIRTNQLDATFENSASEHTMLLSRTVFLTLFVCFQVLWSH